MVEQWGWWMGQSNSGKQFEKTLRTPGKQWAPSINIKSVTLDPWPVSIDKSIRQRRYTDRVMNNVCNTHKLTRLLAMYTEMSNTHTRSQIPNVVYLLRAKRLSFSRVFLFSCFHFPFLFCPLSRFMFEFHLRCNQSQTIASSTVFSFRRIHSMWCETLFA